MTRKKCQDRSHQLYSMYIAACEHIRMLLFFRFFYRNIFFIVISGLLSLTRSCMMVKFIHLTGRRVRLIFDSSMQGTFNATTKLW